MTLQDLKDFLPEWEHRVGANGSHWFLRTGRLFMPLWLNGYKSFDQRLVWNPDHNWFKFQVQFIGAQEEEWDTFFEGTIRSTEDIQFLFDRWHFPDKD